MIPFGTHRPNRVDAHDGRSPGSGPLRLAFPVANQWPLRRGSVRYSRGGGAGITPASRFTLSGTVAPICVRICAVRSICAAQICRMHAGAGSAIERDHGTSGSQRRWPYLRETLLALLVVALIFLNFGHVAVTASGDFRVTPDSWCGDPLLPDSPDAFALPRLPHRQRRRPAAAAGGAAVPVASSRPAGGVFRPGTRARPAASMRAPRCPAARPLSSDLPLEFRRSRSQTIRDHDEPHPHGALRSSLLTSRPRP